MDLEQRASDELKKWEKPYVYQPYPKMLYRGIDQAPGFETCIVPDDTRHREKAHEGWKDGPKEAIAHHEGLQADIGQAAAERAAADRKLSEAAQREAKAAEDANDGLHLGEVPETPIRRSHHAKKDEPPHKAHAKTLNPDDLPPKKKE